MLGASQVDRIGAWEASVRQARARDRRTHHGGYERQFEGVFRVCYLPEPSQSPLIPCIPTLNHPRHQGDALGSEFGA